MHIFKETIINEFAKLQCFFPSITALESYTTYKFFTLRPTNIFYIKAPKMHNPPERNSSV